MLRFLITKSLIITLLTFINLYASAVETIYITQGTHEPIPTAINHFAGSTMYDKKMSDQITSVITNDLVRCGLFKAIPKAAFIETKIGSDYLPLFASWRQINAFVLLNGEVKKINNATFELRVTAWDIVNEKQLFGEAFEVPVQSWRRAAHKVADMVYEKVIGDKGYFDSKIVYVAENNIGLKQVRKIAIMDQDGANHHFLSNGKSLVLTPRFSPKGDSILYLSYAIRKAAKVFLKDLYSGEEHVLGDFLGMSFAPRFSPDGKKAVMSIAKNGITDIYEIDLRTLRMKQLTDGVEINTSPSYSPDGRHIVFNSDRNGTRQLYIMNSDGSDVKRISFGTGRYAEPNWSPKGNFIAFTKILANNFYIGVMKPDGSGERIITSGYLVETPSWSPNGRLIMYAKGSPSTKNKRGSRKIYTIDVNGFNDQQLSTPSDASNPEWSSLLD